MNAWVTWVPVFPLIGFVLNGLFGRRLGLRGTGILASGAIALSFLCSAAALRALLALPAAERSVTVPLYTWFSSGALRVEASFLLDPLSAMMIVMVTGVAFLIHVYSVGYMSHDPGYPRFFAYLNLFTAAMLILVLADNFLLAFVGWEGVGLCSYLLIGFWFQNGPPPAAGMKAFVTNRVGDFGFLLASIIIFFTFGSLRYGDVMGGAAALLTPGGATVTAITLLLFLGATGKSAQIPLHVWLPDAMEGPTPVSALIHAATMVTAGVYMVARCHTLFELAPFTMAVVAAVGTATALVAGTIGLVQVDIKKVLAYSTVSQLGYMFLALGIGAFSAGIFHLLTHAFFKSLLFLAAGSVMHGLSGELDLRKMGGLREKMPHTCRTFLVGSLALAGVIPFAGFFSKDAILGAALVGGHYLVWAVALAAAGLTAVYVFRAYFLAFAGASRLPAEAARHVHESPRVMTVPLMVLAVLAAGGGFLGIPLIAGGNVLGNFLAPVFAPAAGHAEGGDGAGHAGHEAAAAHGHGALGLELAGMALALAVALLGIRIAHRHYVADPARAERVARRWPRLHRLFEHLWFFDEFYAAAVIEPTKMAGRFLARAVDGAVVDGAVNGAGRVFMALAGRARRLQTGIAQNYGLLMGTGAVLVLAWFLLVRR